LRVAIDRAGDANRVTPALFSSDEMIRRYSRSPAEYRSSGWRESPARSFPRKEKRRSHVHAERFRDTRARCSRALISLPEDGFP